MTISAQMLPSPEHSVAFDYFFPDTYDASLLIENDMRNNMYEPEMKDDEMNTNPYYGLVKITVEMWKNYKSKSAIQLEIYSPM